MRNYELVGGTSPDINFNTHPIMVNIIEDVKNRPLLYEKLFKSAKIDYDRIIKLDGSGFINIIRKHFKKVDVRLYVDNNEEYKRTLKIAANLNRLLDGKSPGESAKYLDYGCSNGTITRALAAFYGMDIKNVYGAEIKYWSGRKNDCGVNMVYIEQGKPKLDLPDNYFDLITAFHVLHHCHSNEMVAKELVRVLKPGGRFILREHDLNSKISKEYLDLQHLKFAVNENTYHELDDYYSNYRSEQDWVNIIGLKIIKVDKCPNDMEVFTTVFIKT